MAAGFGCSSASTDYLKQSFKQSYLIQLFTGRSSREVINLLMLIEVKAL